MSVPHAEVRVGRYYRTTIGSAPCVVRVEYESSPGFMCRIVAGQGKDKLKLLKAARLFNEVVQSGDGSGRWTQVDWRTR